MVSLVGAPRRLGPWRRQGHGRRRPARLRRRLRRASWAMSSLPGRRSSRPDRLTDLSQPRCTGRTEGQRRPIPTRPGCHYPGCASGREWPSAVLCPVRTDEFDQASPPWDVCVRAIDFIGGREIISEADCWELLETEQVGCITVWYGGHVDIFPVNYGLDGDGIVFRTNAGRKVTGAASSEVAFEVDNMDAQAKAGWSVVVHGQARDTTGYDGLERQRATQPWTGSKDCLIRTAPRSITGRRAAPPIEPFAFGPSPHDRAHRGAANGLAGLELRRLRTGAPPALTRRSPDLLRPDSPRLSRPVQPRVRRLAR